MTKRRYSQLSKKILEWLSATPVVVATAIVLFLCLWMNMRSSDHAETITKTASKKTNSPPFLDKFALFSPFKDPSTTELLALKTRLEKELSSFYSVESAHIALPILTSLEGASSSEDIAPKQISVIIETKPNFRSLSSSLVHSITHYLCSTISSLSPEDIIISDQHGTIYSQKIFTEDQDGLEDLITSSISRQCEKLFPKNSFSISVCLQKQIPTLQSIKNEDTRRSLKGFITLSLDQNMVSSTDAKELSKRKESIHRYTKDLCLSNGIFPYLFIDTLPLTFSNPNTIIPHTWLLTTVYLLLSIAILVAAYSYLFTKISEKRLYKRAKITGEINMNKLLEVMQNEHPRKISLFLSYLDPKRSEAILMALPKEKREEVLRNSKRQ